MLIAIIILIILIVCISMSLASSVDDGVILVCRIIFLIQCICLASLIYCLISLSQEIGAKKLLNGKIQYKVTGTYKDNKFVPTDTLIINNL